MSKDIDRLIDSAFEHDRERLPKGAASAPASLMQKAALPAASAGGFFAAAWLKIALGMLAVGSVAAYFAVRAPQTMNAPQQAVPTYTSPTTSLPLIDSPVVTRDTITASRPAAPNRKTGKTGAPEPAVKQPPHMMPPIIDSGVKLRDSTIRPLRRER